MTKKTKTPGFTDETFRSILDKKGYKAIDLDGSVMLWHLPEDVKHFRRTAEGHPVIIGRGTWESLPATYRPLPGRTIIVITTDPGWSAPAPSRRGPSTQPSSPRPGSPAPSRCGSSAAAPGRTAGLEF
ncbi:dihydrofolate reductase [Pseudarthrobacter sp. H2]|uniref:dihydrofolate reductase n=1 Tax=Pseudarthrobacter sp. H2 TaxID=3418415 RepID=UPI003CF69F62